MTDTTTVKGTCDPAFDGVRELFADHFAQGLEIGAGVCVVVDGRTVVDLWGGYTDPARSRPWTDRTLVNVFSTTKGITAACVLRLVDEGRVALDRPVADYWPGFERNGKEGITIRHLLCHQAGLPAIDEPLPAEALFDWARMTRAVAEQRPWWTPGTRHGYHARTFGWLNGEVVRRVTGQSIGAYFREAIASPLGIDFHIGLPDREHGRVASITKMPPPPPGVQPNLGRVMVNEPDSATAKAFTNPPLHKLSAGANDPRFRRAELPSSNGHATAAAIARFYAALAMGGELDGVSVLSATRLDEARTVHSDGPDDVLRTPTRFGLGFMLPQPGNALGPNPRAFGHPGMGGSLGFADPEARLGFGYAMNRSQGYILIDDRPRALIEALYAALG